MRKILESPNCHPDKPYWAKGLCEQCYKMLYSRKWRQQNKESVAKTHAKRNTIEYKRLTFKLNRNERLRKIGLSEEAYLKLAEERKNCAICKTELTDNTRVVDHCHSTNTFRDLLCRQCNVGLGNFKDSVELLQAAIDYLLRHKNEEQ